MTLICRRGGDRSSIFQMEERSWLCVKQILFVFLSHGTVSLLLPWANPSTQKSPFRSPDSLACSPAIRPIVHSSRAAQQIRFRFVTHSCDHLRASPQRRSPRIRWDTHRSQKNIFVQSNISKVTTTEKLRAGGKNGDILFFPQQKGFFEGGETRFAE